jgi:hypothetical protein
MRVSISRVKLFKSCRRAYELKYIEGLEPVETATALETGRSYHSKLEELYKTGSFDDSDFSKTSAMAKAYEMYVYPKFKVRAVEEWFSYELPHGHSVVGRVDGVADNGYLVEHKTTSSNLDEYEYSLEWDEQIPCYMLAYGTNRMMYTIIQKPTIRQKKSESDEEFYQRMVDWYAEDTGSKIRCIEVARSDEFLEEFRDSLTQMCDEMERAETKRIFYKNPAYCHHWNRLCEYAQICNNYDRDMEYVNFERRGNGNN